MKKQIKKDLNDVVNDLNNEQHIAQLKKLVLSTMLFGQLNNIMNDKSFSDFVSNVCDNLQQNEGLKYSPETTKRKTWTKRKKN
jgi:hypothetical protein